MSLDPPHVSETVQKRSATLPATLLCVRAMVSDCGSAGPFRLFLRRHLCVDRARKRLRPSVAPQEFPSSPYGSSLVDVPRWTSQVLKREQYAHPLRGGL